MSPSKLLLQLVGLVTLLPSPFGFLVALLDLGIRAFQVGKDGGFALEDLGSLADILHACLIFLTKLAQLSALQEELRSIVQQMTESRGFHEVPCTCHSEKTQREIAYKERQWIKSTESSPMKLA